MKRYVFAILALALVAPLSACKKDGSKATHHEKSKIVKRKIYHFEDGRSGYQDNLGAWWYFNQTLVVNDSSASMRSVPSGTASTFFSPSTPVGTSVAPTAAPPVSPTLQAAVPAESVRGGFGSMSQTYGATGGQWAKGPAPTQEEMDKAEITEEAVTENELGEPETAMEAEAADAKVDVENQAEAQAEAEGHGEAAAEGHAEAAADGGHESGGGAAAEGGGGDTGGGGDGGGGGGGE